MTSINFYRVPVTVSGSSGYVIAPSTTVPNSQFPALDKCQSDLSKAGYPKNGGVILVLAISTPQTIDLTSLASVAYSQAGDTNFATVYDLIFSNFGANDLVASPGSSNGFTGPLGGTSPTFTIPAGSSVRWNYPAGWNTSSSVKTIEFNPGSSACVLSLCVGGA